MNRISFKNMEGGRMGSLRDVAEIFNLPYRRVALGGRFNKS